MPFIDLKYEPGGERRLGCPRNKASIDPSKNKKEARKREEGRGK